MFVTCSKMCAHWPSFRHVTNLQQAPAEFLTTRDVAELFGCSVATVIRRARTGELPVAGKLRGIRGALLFRPDAIDAARQHLGAGAAS